KFGFVQALHHWAALLVKAIPPNEHNRTARKINFDDDAQRRSETPFYFTLQQQFDSLSSLILKLLIVTTNVNERHLLRLMFIDILHELIYGDGVKNIMAASMLSGALNDSLIERLFKVPLPKEYAQKWAEISRLILFKTRMAEVNPHNICIPHLGALKSS